MADTMTKIVAFGGVALVGYITYNKVVSDNSIYFQNCFFSPKTRVKLQNYITALWASINLNTNPDEISYLNVVFPLIYQMAGCFVDKAMFYNYEEYRDLYSLYNHKLFIDALQFHQTGLGDTTYIPPKMVLDCQHFDKDNNAFFANYFLKSKNPVLIQCNSYGEIGKVLENVISDKAFKNVFYDSLSLERISLSPKLQGENICRLMGKVKDALAIAIEATHSELDFNILKFQKTLRKLYVSFSHSHLLPADAFFEKIRDIAPQLTSLTFEFCGRSEDEQGSKIEKIAEIIENAKNLRSLELNKGGDLSLILEKIGQLRNLQNLDLSFEINLERGDIKSLVTILKNNLCLKELTITSHDRKVEFLRDDSIQEALKGLNQLNFIALESTYLPTKLYNHFMHMKRLEKIVFSNSYFDPNELKDLTESLPIIKDSQLKYCALPNFALSSLCFLNQFHLVCEFLSSREYLQFLAFHKNTFSEILETNMDSRLKSYSTYLY